MAREGWERTGLHAHLDALVVRASVGVRAAAIGAAEYNVSMRVSTDREVESRTGTRTPRLKTIRVQTSPRQRRRLRCAPTRWTSPRPMRCRRRRLMLFISTPSRLDKNTGILGTYRCSRMRSRWTR